MPVEYRRAAGADFEQMVELQNKNLFWNLSEEERQQGFLSTAFTAEQFRIMDREIGVAAAINNNQVCGYLCASTAEFNRGFPFPSAMLTHCAHIIFKGKPLPAYRFFVANPICIDRDYRGKGVYLGLRDKILELAGPAYELAVTFISDLNQRSLSASPKANWEIVGRFTYENQNFWILVVRL